MVRRAGAVLVGLAVLMGPAAHAGEGLVQHVPVSELSGGQDVDLRVYGDDPALLATLELHYRTHPDGAWTSLAFRRTETDAWQATVPARDVAPAGLDYYISSGDTPRFASKAAPHEVLVAGSARQLLHARDLFRHDGRRSQAELQYDFRNFGARNGGAVHDRYWMAEAAYTYRPFGVVRAVRLGFSTMRAVGVPLDGPPREWGLDAGHAEAELSPHDLVGLRSRLVLGATGDAFTAGGGGVLRIGFEPGTRVEVAVLGVWDVGWRQSVTLHWITVPRVPMAAGVEVTTWPDASQRAVQGTFQASLPLGDHAVLYGRLGYQARFSNLGGLGLGTGLSWDW